MNTKAFTIETVTITGSIHTDTIEVTSANPESFFHICRNKTEFP